MCSAYRQSCSPTNCLADDGNVCMSSDHKHPTTCILPLVWLPVQVQRMRPSPFNKNSGKPAAAAAAGKGKAGAAAPRPPSNLGKAAAAAPAGKGKSKAVVVDSSEVGGWAAVWADRDSHLTD